MKEYNDFSVDDEINGPIDPAQERSRAELIKFFEKREKEVFFSRQIEVHFEDEFFHWVTNRAIRELVEEGFIKSETMPLKTGGIIKLIRHCRHRYYRRQATDILHLVEEYADPNIGAALGLHGEAMVLAGFAGSQFVMRGRDTRQYENRRWSRSEHEVDFIFEKDSVPYGIEVKNTLRYIDYDEFKTKIKLCKYLRLHPVFAVRMLPRNWIHDLWEQGGFALILKYQLYPWAHKKLARRVARELGLPVDSPRALLDSTMDRFVRWHRKNV